MPSINIRGQLRDFSTPWVMGIINATPDSFYSGSRTQEPALIRERVLHMRRAGVQALDVGGYSSRPGADEVSAEEEYSRLSVALGIIREVWPEVVVSVDTFRAQVARRCVEEWEVDIINDISGGDMDDEMFDVVAHTGVAYILMHMRGTPSTMQSMCDYSDIAAEVIEDLMKKCARLHRMGVKDIILDPGFGFAKTVSQNFELMSHLDDFKLTGYPLLVGISRKSMIYKELGLTPAESLNGTTVLNTYSLMHGADILRVHDANEALQAVHLTQLLKR